MGPKMAIEMEVSEIKSFWVQLIVPKRHNSSHMNNKTSPEKGWHQCICQTQSGKVHEASILYKEPQETE